MKHTSRKIASALILIATCLTTAAAQDAPANGYGKTREQAIEVCRPDGQRAYLARLVCPDQSHPKFVRFGSVGPRNELPADMRPDEALKRRIEDRFAPLAEGAIDHHVVDGYTVTCGTNETQLYLDLYHCHTPPPDVAPEGFTILR